MDDADDCLEPVLSSEELRGLETGKCIFVGFCA